MKKNILSFLALSASLLAVLVLSSFSPAKNKNVHVVWIGLDGWGSYSVEKADMPFVKGMMEQGSYTLKKRSVLPSSSAVNWASMFMGACPELHGYTRWDSRWPEIPSAEKREHNIFPTVFQILRDQRPSVKMGCICEWEVIKYIIDSLSFDTIIHTPDTTGKNALTCKLASDYLRVEKPDMCLIDMDEPDEVGHSAGHDTPAYYAKLHELDGYVEKIVQATKDGGFYDNTVFVITADHGGIGHGHGGLTLKEMEAPFIIFGKGIRKQGAFEGTMMQYDQAPTIAHIFGLKTPSVWNGRCVKEVFEK
jgi:predicted AlkP superfamily pyrophosphatase or phosphodiesterase